jgi:cytoskeletal protein CcmA (bactofilin family)
MRGCLALSSFMALFSILAGPFFVADGAEIRSGEKVVIGKDETIKDDLYVFGAQVTIDGTVEGDVIAFAQQITVNGSVTGNLMAAGETILVTGETGGARIAGKVLKLSQKAKLDGDLLAAGLSLECEKESAVAGDALFAGYQALFAGLISDDLRGGMANCRLEGSIGGNVNVEVGNEKDAMPASTFGPPGAVPMPSVPGGLTIGEAAQIEGDVKYESSLEARVDEGATLNGEIEQVKPQPKVEKEGAIAPRQNPLLVKAISRVKHILCVALVGLVALLVLPRWSTAWADTLRTRPAASFMSGLAGLAAFFVFLVLALIVIGIATVLLVGVRLTELVPMVLVGGAVGYAAVIVGFWLVTAFLAEALAGLAIGRSALRGDSLPTRLLALLIGAVVVGLLLSIPFLGWLVGFVITVLGIGSIGLWFIGQAPPQSFAALPTNKPIPAAV